jgi:hypothetical protein
VVASEASRAARRRQLQIEYEAGLAQLGWRWTGLARPMNAPAYALLAAMSVLAGWFVFLLARGGPGAPAQLGSNGFEAIHLGLLLLVSATFVALGLAATFPRQLRRLWQTTMALL